MLNLEKILQNYSNFLLIFIFILAFALRLWVIPGKNITFAYDQARDFFTVQEITKGDVKIQGPAANAPGLYHGVLYYYFLAPSVWLSGGDPVWAEIWLAFFGALTVFVVYFLCLQLTKNKPASLISALIFAVSSKAIEYSNWLSNPSMAIWFVPLTYLSLWLWTSKKSNWYPILTGLFLGFCVQSDLFLIYQSIPLAIWLYLNKQKIDSKQIFIFLIGFFVGIASIVISQFKFGLQGLKGFIYLLSGGDSVVNVKGLGDFLVIYLNQLGNTVSLNLFPLSLGLGGFAGLILIVWLFANLKKEKNTQESWEAFLLLYIFSHLPIVFLGGLSSPYLTAGIDVAFCITAGIALSFLIKKNWFISVGLILILIISNLIYTNIQNRYSQTIFAIRKEMSLKNIEDVVDYTYQSSNGAKFSINSVTAPLWINTTWSYAYNWYGGKKYGFLPYWHGRNQIGSLGDNLADTPKSVEIYYLIIEPNDGIPQQYIDQTISEENSKSRLIEQKNFGGIIVQKRLAS